MKMDDDAFQRMEDLLNIRPRAVLTKDQWIDRVIKQHDLLDSVARRRDSSILYAVSSGATAAEIARALGNRLTGRRVRQIMIEHGVKPSGKRGRKPGVSPPFPWKSGVAHLGPPHVEERPPRRYTR